MRKITDTLSKEILSAREGEILGIATNAYADGKLSRVRGYKVSSDDRDEGRLLPLSALLGEGDALVVRNRAALRESAGRECPLGAKVYDTTGAFRGVLRDILFDERTGIVLSLLVDENEISPDRILSYGDALLLRAPCHDGVVFRAATSTKKVAHTLSAPAPKEAESVPTEETLPPQEGRKEEPADLFPDYAFLLGRTVVKSIVDGNDVLARSGDLVTHELLLIAREKGKLVELTVNSRK